MSVVLTVDYATLFRIVGAVINEAKPVLIRGKHGIGKSEVVYSCAAQLFFDKELNKSIFVSKSEISKKVGIKLGLPVVERRASQMTEGDLVGLPSINGNRTAFNPPDWFKEACETPVLLFLDEVDRATIEVRQGIFELTDSRKLNGHKLHSGTVIFAAVNGGKYAAQYQVGEMDPAELDRWTVFDVEPTIEDWMVWANTEKDGMKNIHPVVIDFLNHNRDHLEHVSDYEPNKKYPSRRSWKRASDVLASGDYLIEHKNDVVPLCAAFCGMEAGIAFGDFVKNSKKLLTPEDIIINGRWKDSLDFTINDHCALIDKIENSGILKNKFSDSEAENFARYFLKIPSECCAKLFKTLGKTGNKENTIAFYKLKIDGIAVSDFMVKMLAPQSAVKKP